MKYLLSINEKLHVNQHIRHLTNIIYSKVSQMIPNLILKKEVVIKNLLKDNYNKIKFDNDEIIIKLGRNHGAINNPIINSDIVTDIKIYLTIELNNNEKITKKLLNNKIRETINHELQHIIELLFSKNLSNSWSFNKRLKEHQDKFLKCDKWMDICHILYLSEEHEIRSRISQSLELIKNSNDTKKELLNSSLYKEFEFLSKIKGEHLINIMRKEYKNFDEIIKDFVENVLLKNGKYDIIFIKEINSINKKAKASIKKILNILYFHLNNNIFLEEYIEKEIDYKKYL